MTHTFQSKNRVVDYDNPTLVPITPSTGATVLVIGIVVYQTTARTGAAPSFNGVSMTQAGTGIAAGETTIEMWYLINPSIGAYNVSIPNTNTRDLHVVASVYAAQAGYSTEFDVTNKANGDSPNISVTLTPTVNGDVIVDTCGSGDPDGEDANSDILLYSSSQGGFTDLGQYKLQDIAAAHSMTYTTAWDDWCIIAAAFKEVSVGPTGHPWYYERKQ